MKLKNKIAAALMIVTAGSMFFATAPAKAEEITAGNVEPAKAGYGYHHGRGCPPPPPPDFGGPRGPREPRDFPPHHHHFGPRGHVPPPPPDFGGPRGPRGPREPRHMPPPEFRGYRGSIGVPPRN